MLLTPYSSISYRTSVLMSGLPFIRDDVFGNAEPTNETINNEVTRLGAIGSIYLV